MKTSITVSILLFFISFTGFAQIKLGLPKGTPDGSAILDLSNTSATVKKGFLGPQVALSGTGDATTVSTPATGLMVYNTTAAGSGSTAVVAGYYYHNGTQWVQMVSSAAPASGNIYTADGTLAAARTVTMGANALNFTGAGGVNINTTSTSQYPLSIIQPLQTSTNQPGIVVAGASGTAATGQSAFIGFNPNNVVGAWPIIVGAQYVNGSAGQGAADFIVATSGGGAGVTRFVVQNGGNVGIGTTTPGAKLEVAGGGSTFGAAAIFNNTTATTGRKFSIASRTDITNGTGQNGLFAIADESASQIRLVVDQVGNVGIGTANPATKLELKGGGTAFPASSGTTQSAGLIARLRDGSANGFLDIGGNATSGSWLQATDATSLATTYPILLNPIGGNVGIGTTAPTAKLDVAGAARIQSISQTTSVVNTAPAVTTLHPVYADASGNIVKFPQMGSNVDTVGITRIFYFPLLASGTATATTGLTGGLGFFGTYEITVAISNSGASEAVARFLFTGNNNFGQNQLRYIDGNTDVGNNATTAITTASSAPVAVATWNASTQIIVTYPGGAGTITLKAGQNTGGQGAFSVAQTMFSPAQTYVVVKKIF